MLKGVLLWAFMFAFYSLAAALSEFKAKDTLQFTPKRLAELHQQHLMPLEIQAEVIEESFSNNKLTRNLKLTLKTSAKILSDLVLSKSSKEPLRLGENNQCTDIVSSQALKSLSLIADIVFIVAGNNNNDKRIVTPQKCELGDNKSLLSIVLRINEKEFSVLDNFSQVKELCAAISDTLFENREEEKEMVLEEIKNYFDKAEFHIIETCQEGENNCKTCANENNCEICNPGYWNNTGICVLCTSPCNLCTSEIDCQGCIDGYYLNNNFCASCETSCAQCSENASNCQSCVTGYYLSGSTCIACDPACTACSGSSTICSSCANGYWLSGTTCLACNSYCVTCIYSEANCLSCVDPVHMGDPPFCSCPPNGYLEGSTCQCEENFYYSSDTVCSACDPNCADCQNTASNCTTCADSVHMTAAPACLCPENSTFDGISCVCNGSSYFSSDTVCSSCSPNCLSCQTHQDNCLTCIDGLHMSAPPACACPALSTLIGDECQCVAGYYFNPNSFKCEACSPSCVTCNDAPLICNTCVDPVHMSAAPACACPTYSTFIDSTCVCNEGYFFSSTKVCSPCPLGCETCSSFTSCQECYDPKSAYNEQQNQCICDDEHAYINIKTNICVCMPGYFNDTDNSGLCTSCYEGCKVCTSVADCQTCWDPYMSIDKDGICNCPDPNSTYNDTQHLCVCHEGYFQSASSCVPCSLGCQTCLAASYCTQCYDDTRLWLVHGACICNGAPAWTYNSATQTCVCSAGYYQNGTNCDQCSPGCIACIDVNTCQTCSDPHSTLKDGICVCNDPNAVFQSNVCMCVTGFYQNEDTCLHCSSGCMACKNTTYCMQCFEENMTNNEKGSCLCPFSLQTFDNATHQCECPLHMYPNLDRESCMLCDITCNSCQTSDDCLDCYDPNNMVNNMDGTCSCKDASKRFSITSNSCIDTSSGAFKLENSWLLLGFVSLFYLA